MIKTKFKSVLITIFLAIALVLSSNDDGEASITNIPTTSDGFNWNGNGTTILKKVVNPRFSSRFNTFTVKDASGGTLFKINFNVGTVGTYNLGSDYAIAYTNSSFDRTAGNLIITSNESNKITGKFTSTYSAGTVNSILGTFKNVAFNS